ncbi:MAG: hypothetical protein IJ945_02870 [Oscillospiraceae bacterium]|nr:hypothetical protein [Oscillospiraceae bacterium]
MKKRFFIILAGFLIVLCCVLFFGKGENLFEEGDFFIKTVTMEDRIYCLTEKGLFLEYNIKTEKFTKLEEDVKDFYAYDFDIFTVLFKDGTVKGLYDTEDFMPEALFLESDALRMKDNSVFYFDTWEKEWKKVESDSKKAVPNQLSAVILDEKDVLCNFSYDTKEKYPIAEKVKDFCLGDADETYYFPDLLYIDEEGRLFAFKVNDIGMNDFAPIDYTADEVFSKIHGAFHGGFIAETAEGKFLFGSINDGTAPFEIPMEASFVSLFNGSFSAIDKNDPRIIHYCADVYSQKMKTIECG